MHTPEVQAAPVGVVDPDVTFFEENGFLGPIEGVRAGRGPGAARPDSDAQPGPDPDPVDNDVNYDRHFDIPELTQHIGHPRIVAALRKLLGRDLFCWRTEFFPKFPGDKGTEWHQVSKPQSTTGAPMLQPVDGDEAGPLDLTVWTAFTEATRQNGCMKFLPGSHKKLYYDEAKAATVGRDEEYVSVQAGTGFFGYNFEDFKVDPAWAPNESEAIALEMQAGECVIFTARCVHASLPNTTRRSTRFAITARYVPASVRVYPDWTEFYAHGGRFDLTNYGVVLVSGTDRFGGNRVRRDNNRGERFPYVAEP